MKFQPEISILLVDDDSIDVRSIEILFKRHELEDYLHVATDGVDAWNRLKGLEGQEKISPQPKIMFIDINMPRMNGLELVQKIRADDECRSAMIFILSGSSKACEEFQQHDLNIAGYFLKPVSFENIVMAMEQLETILSMND